MEVRDWPDLLSDAPAMGGMGCGAGLPRLKRGQGSRHLGVDMAFNADNEDGANQRHKHFTSSGNGRKTQREKTKKKPTYFVLLKTKVMLFP